MKKVLITGANKSIGLETARQLLQLGYHVFIGSRSLENGEEAVKQLKAEGLNNVEAVQLDITDQASVQGARVAIGEKTDTLDVLINNAGILGAQHQTAGGTSPSLYKEVLDTNLFGAVQMNQAFIDLLLKSSAPRIVNVTSGLGSITLQQDSSWPYYQVNLAAYSVSKAALNMYTILLAVEFQDTALKINAVDPGFTATDFNHHTGTGTVEVGAARVVKGATLGVDGPTGAFFSEDNSETGISPW
jgi:NAD(P)-dependent dehydrogenase (short-subunit alcohol dehydrogenase family)